MEGFVHSTILLPLIIKHQNVIHSILYGHPYVCCATGLQVFGGVMFVIFT
jgi:hypothetical protein